jgi:beta-galactosidase
VPEASNKISFNISGPGEIVATDNGNPADMTSFGSTERNVFNGLALLIVRAKPGIKRTITIKATADGLPPATLVIHSN